MQPITLTVAHVERFLAGFAEHHADAPGAPHLVELAADAQAIPEPLLTDLAAAMSSLDPDAVASVLAVRAREVAYDGVVYRNASDFVRAVGAELHGYLNEPELTAQAVADLKRELRGVLH